MNVALCGPVSTSDNGQDTENQLSQLRAFARTQGWTVVREYVDCVSGKHSDRSSFSDSLQTPPGGSST
jgi:DNA invertase Pin-like site-specific DNA recombinase